MKYAKIKPKGLNSMIIKLEDVYEYLIQSEVNEQWEIIIIELSEEEYQNLPESNGF